MCMPIKLKGGDLWKEKSKKEKQWILLFWDCKINTYLPITKEPLVGSVYKFGGGLHVTYPSIVVK